VLARILPFAAYVAFLAITQTIPSWPVTFGNRDWQDQVALWSYPVKTAVVLILLIYFRHQYDELRRRPLLDRTQAALSLGIGLIVYAFWVRLDWSWAVQGEGGEARGYNPFMVPGAAGLALAGIRLFGASAVVPVMEELFWRSFLLRYVISSKFESIPLGMFTPFSFGITVVLFGFEHDLWLAGMVAGAAYNGLLYYTKRLWSCVLAHGTTNLALGIHVLATGEWQWW